MENLETHLLEGSENTADNDAPRLSMDDIKSLCFKNGLLSHKHVTIYNNQVCSAETSINEVTLQYSN